MANKIIPPCSCNANKVKEQEKKEDIQFIAYGYDDTGGLQTATSPTKDDAVEQLAIDRIAAMGIIQVENRSKKEPPVIPVSKMIIG